LRQRQQNGDHQQSLGAARSDEQFDQESQPVNDQHCRQRRSVLQETRGAMQDGIHHITVGDDQFDAGGPSNNRGIPGAMPPMPSSRP